MCTIPPDVHERVIFAVAIDVAAVEFFGAAFDIDPLFFGGHITAEFLVKQCPRSFSKTGVLVVFSRTPLFDELLYYAGMFPALHGRAASR
jgi:hypothetical protein